MSKHYIHGMIVRELDGRILLITQPDHAHLAGRIMSHCAALKKHPRRDTILRAVAEHDTGWAAPDAKPGVDAALGHVLDFIHAPTEVRQNVWPRSVAIVSDVDHYAAALIAQHAITVYARLRSSGEWQEFFAEMTAVRDGLLSMLGVPLDQLEQDYVFVRLGDLISLAFCTGSDDLNQFGEWRVTRSANRVTIAPDIFGGEEIPISVSAMEIPARKYRSDEELHAAIKWPRTVTLHGVVSGA
jgi:hypothetical protein